MKNSKILVLGAARSGKSRYAQGLAEQFTCRRLYVATAEIIDREMQKRVEAHRRARGDKWVCVEEPLDIARVIRGNSLEADVMLIDCVTVWLGNVLHKEGEHTFEKRAQTLVEAFRAAPCPVILVANEVGMGIVPDNELGRTFRDLAGRLNQILASEANTVVFLVAGLPMILKGRIDP